MKPLALALLVAVFYALHQDFWNWRKTEPLLFGFLPVGLWYHVAYSVAASVVLWILVRTAWPRELEELGTGPVPRTADDTNHPSHR